jgi:hypothetical protein
MLGFGCNVRLIRCRPAEKQNVVPDAALSITSAAFWSVLIVVPLHAGACEGPAGNEPGGAGVVAGGWVGVTVGVTVGLVVLGVAVGVTDGAVGVGAGVLGTLTVGRGVCRGGHGLCG